jgi:hypothetical protein
VLWTAIAMMQREHRDVVSVVYSGDTDATKEEIISKVKVRLISYFWFSRRALTAVHRRGSRSPSRPSRSTLSS